VVLDTRGAAGISRLQSNPTRSASHVDVRKDARKFKRLASKETLNGTEPLDNRHLLKQLQERITWSDQTEKNLSLALINISNLAVELSLPLTVLEQAALLYKQIVQKRVTSGRSMQALCGAAVYAACRQCGSVRDLREIARVARIEKQTVIRYYRMISRELDSLIPAARLTQYAPRIFVNIGVQGKVAELANKILNVIEGSKIGRGREPASLVSAAAYMGSKLAGEKVTQRKISIASGVTEVTIRNTCKELQKKLAFVMSV
jgi:transcription initiation factor TFIIB